MTRLIKFRAWHKTKHIMSPVLDICFWGHTVTLEHLSVCDADDVVLMQYTGVKDKNGVEICDGDIIEFDAFEWGEDTTNRDVVKWDCDYAAYRALGFPGEWRWFCSVIGNKFQNQDLLDITPERDKV